MLKKIFALSAIVVGVLALTGTANALVYKIGSNYVSVDKCEQIGSDIRVKRFNQTYNLTSTCRNAGHGNRQYVMKCVSSTKYFVSWTDVCTSTPTSTSVSAPIPVPTPMPIDTESPKVNINYNTYYKNQKTGEAISTIYVNATDNIKVVRIDLYRGKNLIRTEYASSLEYTIQNYYNNDNDDIYARASDTAGNVGYSNIIKVDVVYPENIPTVQISKTNSWSNGNSQEVTAVASGCGVNDYVDYTDIVRVPDLNTKGDSVKKCTSATCAHTFQNNSTTQDSFYVFAYARCHYSGKMAKSDDLYMSVVPAPSIVYISANPRLYMESGVSYIELLGAATGNNNISSVEIYWGHDNDKTNDKLIKKCVTNNVSTNNCALTYPIMLSPSGWWWAKVWYNNASSSTETGINYFNL